MKAISYSYRILMVAMCLISGNFVFGVHPIPTKKTNHEIIEAYKSKSQFKREAKIERKAKRLGNKISKLETNNRQMSKSTSLLVFGAVCLLIGIIILLGVPGIAISSATTGLISYLVEVALYFALGLVFGLIGFIVMLVGLSKIE